MGWFDKLLGRETRNIENPNIPLTDFYKYFGVGGEAASGVTVTTDTALGVPAVWSAVNFLSDTVATLPLKVYDRGEETPNDPLHAVLHDAVNPELTSYKWRKKIMTDTLTGGRSFTFIERNVAGQVINLWPLDPLNVTVRSTPDGTVYDYEAGTRFVASEIVDIPFLMAPNNLDFYSPIYQLRNAIGLAIALESYASRFFQGGGVPPLQLIGPFNSAATAERASYDVTEAVKAVKSKGGNVLPLPTGHELKPIGIDPSDGQMTEARRFVVEEVARIYGLPPVFVGDLTRATFSNAEQQDLHLVKHTINHWVSGIEQEFNLKLFGRDESRRVKFNLDGILRGAFSDRMSGQATAVQNGIRTPNEARALENLPPMPGGDQLMIQGATRPLEFAGAEFEQEETNNDQE